MVLIQLPLRFISNTNDSQLTDTTLVDKTASFNNFNTWASPGR